MVDETAAKEAVNTALMRRRRSTLTWSEPL